LRAAYSGLAYYYQGTVDQILAQDAMPERELRQSTSLTTRWWEAHFALPCSTSMTETLQWQHGAKWLELSPTNAKLSSAYGFFLTLEGV
jgi:hypothetical protein